MTRQAQPKHQQNTRFLGHEIIGDNKTVRGLLWRDNHASGGGAGGEHYWNTGLYRVLPGVEKGAGIGATTEARQHQTIRAVLPYSVDQDTVGSAIGIDNVNARQRLSTVHIKG